MAVDPKIEAATRKLLGHAIRGEMDHFYELIADIGPEVYEGVGELVILAAGYIATDISGRWPSRADIAALAEHGATPRHSQVTETEIREHLTRVVFGGEPVLEVFAGDERAPLVPVFVAADLLLSFSGNYGDQWEYLDAIWNALDAAENVDGTVVPAVIYLAGKQRA